MAILLKQSTADTLVVGPVVDKDDGVTPETGLGTGSVDAIKFIKADGTTVDISGSTTLTSIGDGYFTVTVAASDVDTLGQGRLIIRDDDVCLPVWLDVQVVPANVYDALVSGSDRLEVDVREGVAPIGTAMRGTDNALLAASISLDGSGRVTVGTIIDGALSGITSLTNLFRLLFRSDAAINTDASTTLGEINASQGSGAGDYDNQTDSQEAVRDVEPHGTVMRGTDNALQEGQKYDEKNEKTGETHQYTTTEA